MKETCSLWIPTQVRTRPETYCAQCPRVQGPPVRTTIHNPDGTELQKIIFNQSFKESSLKKTFENVLRFQVEGFFQPKHFENTAQAQIHLDSNKFGTPRVSNAFPRNLVLPGFTNSLVRSWWHGNTGSSGTDGHLHRTALCFHGKLFHPSATREFVCTNSETNLNQIVTHMEATRALMGFDTHQVATLCVRSFFSQMG